MSRDEERIDIAYHEAGHAVVAKKLGLWVSKVALDPPITVRGDTRDDLIHDAVCVAGYQANLWYDTMTGWGSEIREQEHRARSTLDIEMCRTDSVIATMIVHDILAENWQKVQSVAEALLGRGSLGMWRFNRAYRKIK